jgi:hypothetical protein
LNSVVIRDSIPVLLPTYGVKLADALKVRFLCFCRRNCFGTPSLLRTGIENYGHESDHYDDATCHHQAESHIVSGVGGTDIASAKPVPTLRTLAGLEMR